LKAPVEALEGAFAGAAGRPPQEANAPHAATTMARVANAPRSARHSPGDANLTALICISSAR
jgi:hypothetical protein